MVRAVGKYGLGLLITPHGDRKLPFVGAANAGGSSGSLPLMGIGNQTWPPCWLVWPSGDSLPLMGIGNGKSAGDLEGFPGAHYPSWGSETVVGCPGLQQGYGDSLPLMGIGNVLKTWANRKDV